MLQYDLKHYFFKNSNLIDDVFKTQCKKCKKEHDVKHCYLGQMGLYIFYENDMGLNTKWFDKWLFN